ncbi:WD40 repeat domain-containing protein [Archangium lipolyticum]|uniref:WD40 repeat domain-containing protein n=1 Tax=Archangium lipolyticum TaxID=2970465 RepID=UPI002149A556|nr:WD40 repeat domain-containing protein [Archangium lipolyticum]
MNAQHEPITVANASRLQRVRQLGPAMPQSCGQNLAFAHRGTVLVSQESTRFGRLRWWNLHSGSDLATCSPDIPFKDSFAVLPGRELVVAVGLPTHEIPSPWRDQLVALSTRDGALQHQTRFYYALQTLCASEDGSLLAMMVDEGRGLLWDVERWRPLREMEATSRVFSSYGCALSPDNRFLAAAQSQSVPDEGPSGIQLWDATTGALLFLLPVRDPLVWDVAFHPTEPLLAVGTNGNDILVVDLETRRIVRTIDSPRAWRLSFSPDGSLLAVGGDGCGFHVHRFDTGARLFGANDDNDTQTSEAVFSPDGTCVAWGQGDHTVGLWAVAD